MRPLTFGLVLPAGSPTRDGRATFVADLNRALSLIAGHFEEEEYCAYGYDFPPASVRVAQLEETIQIIKAMWMQEQGIAIAPRTRMTLALWAHLRRSLRRCARSLRSAWTRFCSTVAAFPT